MSYSELDGPRPKTALDDEYVKALSIINQQREEIDRLRAALSSAPPDLVALRLVLKCAERACNDDNTDTALDYVREAIRHVDKLAPAPPVAETPPEGVVETAVRQANYSPCQSKRGVVVFTLAPSRVSILSRGYNRKPIGFECDGSDACKATCRTEAVHAEQDALIGARVSLSGADLVHVKAVNGVLVPSGGPSCVACSKLMVEAGIAGVWLFHESGWMRYQMSDFHRLSLKPASPVVAPAPPDAETPEVLPPSGYKSPMQRHYETPEFKAAWAAGKAERDAASPVVAPAPVVDEATHLLWTGLVRYLDEQFGLALRPEHCLMIKSMLVNRAQPIDAPRPDRSEPIAAPAPVVETVTITLEQLASIEWALYVDAQRKCPACEALRRNDIHKPECWIAAALSPRETPDGGGR